MSDLATLIRLQARIATFLAELPLDRLVALADGRATLTVADSPAAASTLPAVAVPPDPRPINVVEPVASTPPVRPAPRARRPPSAASAFDADAVAARLRAAETLDEGTELLAALNPSSVHLKLLAKALGIPAGKTKGETAKKILTLTVGSRSKHAALRQG